MCHKVQTIHNTAFHYATNSLNHPKGSGVFPSPRSTIFSCKSVMQENQYTLKSVQWGKVCLSFHRKLFIGAGSITLRDTKRVLYDTLVLFTSQESSFCLPFTSELVTT
jgi:hypothetical protein